MGRTLVTQNDSATLLRLPIRLAFHQHLHPRLQMFDVPILPRDDIGHVIDGADEMSKPFFEGAQLV